MVEGVLVGRLESLVVFRYKVLEWRRPACHASKLCLSSQILIRGAFWGNLGRHSGDVSERRLSPSSGRREVVRRGGHRSDGRDD